MATINEWNYFPAPVFTNVRDDGSFTLEWVLKDGRGHMSINFDDSKDLGQGESNMYAIYTARDDKGHAKIKQELIWVNSPVDVLKALALLGLKAE